MEYDDTTRERCDALHEQIVTAMKELIRLHGCDRLAIPIHVTTPQLYIVTGTAQDLIHHGRLLMKEQHPPRRREHYTPSRNAQGAEQPQET
jgi:hypothetical protein